jgi:hypothetical protein
MVLIMLKVSISFIVTLYFTYSSKPPIQTGPGPHPASYVMGTGSFPVVKRPGRVVDRPPPFVPRVKKGNSYTQGIHKRMVQFQKLTINLFLNLHGHNVHRQQWQLFKFLMHHQQFSSHAYCW